MISSTAWRQAGMKPPAKPRRRQYFAVSESEMPAFREWLTYAYPGTKRKPSRVITGRRCIYVVRLTPFLNRKLGRQSHEKPETFDEVEHRLVGLFGAAQTALILRNFFN